MDCSQLPPAERAEGYRKLAEEALDSADKAVLEPERALYLRLATKWLELADLITKHSHGG